MVTYYVEQKVIVRFEVQFEQSGRRSEQIAKQIGQRLTVTPDQQPFVDEEQIKMLPSQVVDHTQTVMLI